MVNFCYNISPKWEKFKMDKQALRLRKYKKRAHKAEATVKALEAKLGGMQEAHGKDNVHAEIHHLKNVVGGFLINTLLGNKSNLEYNVMLIQ